MNPPFNRSRRNVLTGVLGLTGLAGAGSALAAAWVRGAVTPVTPLDAADDIVDIRGLVGGDGEIGGLLRSSRFAGHTLWIDAGKYTVSGVVDFAGATLRAHPQAHITARGEGGTMFRAQGALGPVGRLSIGAAQGGMELELAATGALSPGDWLLLFDPTDRSWSRSRPYYRAGEWCQVRSIAGRSVTLMRPLWADYAADRVVVYRPSLASFTLDGGNWDTADKALVQLILCRDASVNVGTLRGRATDLVRLDRCVGAKVAIRNGSNLGVGRDDYLIGVGSCFAVEIAGGTLFGRRHAIAFGGADVAGGVPNRDCVATGCEIRNDMATGLAAADIHGNSERCGYRSCVIVGGVNLGGADPICSDCTIVARADGNAAEISEFLGGFVDMRNSKVESEARNVGGGRGVIDFGTQNNQFSADTVRDTLLDLSGIQLSAPNLATNEAIVRLNNQGSRASFSVMVDGGSVKLRNPVQFVRAGGRRGSTTRGKIVLRKISGLPLGSARVYSERGAEDQLILASTPDPRRTF